MQQQDRKRPGVAVIVIDLQKGMFEPVALHDAEVLVERVRSVIAWARREQHLVCFIRHDGEEGDALAAGEPGWPVFEALGQSEGEPTFSKAVGDAFSQPRLCQWLADTEEVILLGAQSEYCIAATTAGALAHGLRVTVIGDAHSTFDAGGRNAQDIIAAQNRRFEHQGAEVIATAELLDRERAAAPTR